MIIFKVFTRLLGGFWELKAKCQNMNPSRLRDFYVFLYKMNQKTVVCDIDFRSHFDGVPCFPHGMHGVFVSRWAKVGKGCVILQNVTIGSNTLPDSKSLGAPVIGDNCYIGAGAAIIGACTVGNNVRIGANCVVTKDVPDNSAVVSSVQRVIEKENLDNRYYVCPGRKWGYFDDDSKWHEETDPEILGRFASRFAR
jgi:serine O-acetyltransferase